MSITFFGNTVGLHEFFMEIVHVSLQSSVGVMFSPGT